MEEGGHIGNLKTLFAPQFPLYNHLPKQLTEHLVSWVYEIDQVKYFCPLRLRSGFYFTSASATHTFDHQTQ